MLQDNIKQIKDSAIVVDVFQYQPLLGRPIYCLDDIIELLKNAKEQNQNIAVSSNGIYLYSMLDDEDSCYLKICGKTKSDFQQEMSI